MLTLVTLIKGNWESKIQYYIFLAEVQWCKVALCLPLMATKATKSVCQFRKGKVISVMRLLS